MVDLAMFVYTIGAVSHDSFGSGNLYLKSAYTADEHSIRIYKQLTETGD